MSEKFEKYVAVTPADDTAIDQDYQAIYIGTGGNLAVRSVSGGAASVIPVPNGALLRLKVYSIDSTNTTASGIFLFYDI